MWLRWSIRNSSLSEFQRWSGRQFLKWRQKHLEQETEVETLGMPKDWGDCLNQSVGEDVKNK